jgi:hypothetical protein
VPKLVTFEVTAEDIRTGVRCSSCSCPVSLALARAYPDSGRALVSGYRIYLGNLFCTRTGVVEKFVRRFDLCPKFLRWLFVRPFTTTLTYYGVGEPLPLEYRDF